jgi:hypothetical protein
MVTLITWNLDISNNCVVLLKGIKGYMTFKNELALLPPGQVAKWLDSRYGVMHIHEGKLRQHWSGDELEPLKAHVAQVIQQETGVPAAQARYQMFDTKMVKVKRQKKSVFP